MINIDLNLLRVFDTLYELSSVTRAADRMGLTQSAVSHALGRLRQAVGDPLFVRRSGGLQPTARAVEIAPGIREGLQQLRGALSPAPFDPATANRRFQVNAGSYFCTLLIPALMARLRRLAPGVSLSVGALGPELLPSLDNGSIEIALGAFGKVPPRLVRRSLFSEQMVWIARSGHPVLQAPDRLARLPAGQRLEIAVGRPYPGHGGYSWENGLERLVITMPPDPQDVAADDRADDRQAGQPSRLHDVHTAIATVAATDLVALVPRQLALKAAQVREIALLDQAGPNGQVEMAMLWHARQIGDAGLQWLRAQILACLDQAMQPEPGH